jgi:uncharacterized Tic20 family protein
MTDIAIPNEDRTMAALTHLSGLSSYIIPFGGILVPIIIYLTRDDSPIIRAVAKQAILLNLIVFALFVASLVLLLTIILIPVVILFWCVLGLAAVVLPIVGALKANKGEYYQYPVVGSTP